MVDLFEISLLSEHKKKQSFPFPLITILGGGEKGLFHKDLRLIPISIFRIICKNQKLLDFGELKMEDCVL